MSEEVKDSTKQVSNKDGNVVSKSKRIINNQPFSSKKYSFGAPALLLGAVLIVMVSILFGYSLSRHNTRVGVERKFGGSGAMAQRLDNDQEMGGQNVGRDMQSRGVFRGEMGAVSAVSSSSITIKPLQGGLTTFTFDSGTKIMNSNSEGTLSDIKVGQNVRIKPNTSDTTIAGTIVIIVN